MFEGSRNRRKLNFLKCSSYRDVTSFQNVQVIEIFELSKCSSYQDVSSFQNVRVIEMFEFSKCSSYRNARVIGMLELSRCSSYQNVRVIEMFKLSKYSSYRNVQVIEMFELSSSRVIVGRMYIYKLDKPVSYQLIRISFAMTLYINLLILAFSRYFSYLS